jgi:hypothetical protein
MSDRMESWDAVLTGFDTFYPDFLIGTHPRSMVDGE